MQNQPILRRKHFIFDFPVEGTARINVSESGKLREAGARIGSLVLASFKKKNPIDALLLYGYIGVGKTDLLSGIVHSFDGSNDIPDEQPVSKTYERYNCWPAVHKVNLRRGISRFNASFKPRSNEMLIVEWPEAFADKDTEAFVQYEDRLEIELLHCIKEDDPLTMQEIDVRLARDESSMIFLNVVGYGKGKEIVEALKA